MSGSQVFAGTAGTNDTTPAPPSGAASQHRSPNSAPAEGLFARASIFQIVFSFAAMLGTCLIARVFYTLRSFQVDPDLWWHIKTGEGILSTHHWPTADAYSFTAAGQHWLAYQWLGDVLLAAVYRTSGLRGLGALLIVLGSLVALALYYFATIRCDNPKAGFVVAAVLLNLAMVSFNLRPQMLGYLFLVLTLIVLERFRQGKRGALWLLPLLMLVWINTHGSWIIGLATIGIYLASGLTQIRVGTLQTQRWSAPDVRQLAIVLALCTLATVITPYGASLAKDPFAMAFSSPVNVANIQEWQPLRFTLPGDKLFIALLLGFLLSQMLTPLKLRLEEVTLFLAGAVMACLHLRLLLVFVPFCAPVFAVPLARWLPAYNRAKEIYVLNAAIMLAIFAAMVWYFPSQADYARIVGQNYPVAAVQYLDSHVVPGPMYNSYNFGGYLVFARGPEHPVFIDGRADLYEHGDVLSDVVQLVNLKPGSLAVLEKYEIQSCLLSRYDTVATVLAMLPEWQKVYADDNSILLVRRPSDAPQRPTIPATQSDATGNGPNGKGMKQPS
jgi:hypothetical protein